MKPDLKEMIKKKIFLNVQAYPLTEPEVYPRFW